MILDEVSVRVPSPLTDPDTAVVMIPLGIAGERGPQGIQGIQGIQGPVGPQGPIGNTGSQGPAATITVGSTATLTPGMPATVTNTGSSSAAIFNFGIPQGLQGLQGPQGATGNVGPTGTAATVQVGTTSTLTPGSAASVTNVGTINAAVFNFGIPQGIQGIQGVKGSVGDTGPQGPQGIKGDTGATGATGSTGIQGPAGPMDEIRATTAPTGAPKNRWVDTSVTPRQEYSWNGSAWEALGSTYIPPPETDGLLNTAYGTPALTAATGYLNSALGIYALQSGGSGGNNTAAGAYTLTGITTGSSNTGIGYSAGYSMTTGSFNVAMGAGSLETPKGIGGNKTTIANYQVAIGTETGAYTAGTGDYITAIGYRAVAHTGATALGADSQAQGTDSLAVGRYAEARGNNSTAIGWGSVAQNNKSTAIGYGAMATLAGQIMLGTATETVYTAGNLIANNDLAVGKIYTGAYAGIQRLPVGGSASSGNAILLGSAGDNQMYFMSAVGSNVYIRPSYNAAAQWAWTDTYATAGTPLYLPADPIAALHAATKQYVDSRAPIETDVNGNTGYGINSIPAITGTDTAAFGYCAGQQLTSGINNTAIGGYALRSSGSGINNTAVGYLALYGANSNNNTAIGASSQYAPGGNAANLTLAGSNQTSVGLETGQYAAGTVDFITTIGYRAVAAHGGTSLGASSQARGNYSTAIGYGAIATLDNQIMLGTATETVYAPGGVVANTGIKVGKVWDGSWYGIQQLPLGTTASAGPLLFFVNNYAYIVSGAGGTITLRPEFDINKEWAWGITSCIAKTPLILPADPTTALQAATKQYVDTKWTMWSGTQAAYDAIGTKDPNTLYVVI